MSYHVESPRLGFKELPDRILVREDGAYGASREHGEPIIDHWYVPEQTIATTLGVSDATGKRQGDAGTCRNVHEPPKDTTFWPSPHFKCSECGATHVSMEYVFYCPNCGRRVVEVDE